MPVKYIVALNVQRTMRPAMNIYNNVYNWVPEIVGAFVVRLCVCTP